MQSCISIRRLTICRVSASLLFLPRDNGRTFLPMRPLPTLRLESPLESKMANFQLGSVEMEGCSGSGMAAGPLLLDGGTGHLLKAKGVEQLVSGLKYEELFLAGSLANVQCPDLVRAVHSEYIAAGADVITTNSFACTQWSLAKIGRADMAGELTSAAGRIAREAADAVGRPVLVAGTLPPLQESYQTAGLPPPQGMQQEYQGICEALIPHVDLLLCETLASIEEGVAAGSVASRSGRPWWVSWTLQDNEEGRLRSGERLEDAVAAVAHLPGLQGLLINCCSPQAVTAALPRLRACAPEGVHLVGGYANGFRTTTSQWLAESTLEISCEGLGGSGSVMQPLAGAGFLKPPAEEYDAEGIILPEAYAQHALAWRQLGATVVGGCCGVGPAHIACVARALRRAQQQQ